VEFRKQLIQVIDKIERRKVRESPGRRAFRCLKALEPETRDNRSGGARRSRRREVPAVLGEELTHSRIDVYASTVKPRSAKNRASIPGPAPKSNRAAPGGAILRTRSWNARARDDLIPAT